MAGRSPGANIAHVLLLHSLMLVLLNGGRGHFSQGIHMLIKLHSLMLVLLNGGIDHKRGIHHGDGCTR